MRKRSTSENITLHNREDFSGMYAAGRVVARILDDLCEKVFPGVTTRELDDYIRGRVEVLGAKSATIGYRGYKHASCISVNHVVCHGIPGSKTLRNGDILNIDVTVIYNGWYGDSSRMYVAGVPKLKARRLMQVAHDALMLGLEQIRPGNTFGDIGHAIQQHARRHRMSVVRAFCGHGIGREFHLQPNVLHFGVPGTGATLQEGMFFTVEPMINLGRSETRLLPDGWTAITQDRMLSAQLEHSVGVSSDGCEIFTLSPEKRFYPTNFEGLKHVN